MILFLSATPSAKPIPAGVENGSLAGKQTWFLNEIKEFLNKFVFDKEALEHLEGMSEKITEMKELETEGFLCRYHGCGRKFKYHSGRVK